MVISVITVCYNSEKTIVDTFNSILRQSHQEIEYIIIDGLSTDRTVDIISEYLVKFKELNINVKWISEKDNGIYDAINKGISLATGEVIGILNADDYFYDSHSLSRIADCFDEMECDCLYGNLKYVNRTTGKTTRIWKSKTYEKGLFEKSWTPAHPTFYCKKSIYNKYGLYRTDFKIAADVELMFRFLEKYSIPSYFLNQYLVIMRQGGISNNGVKSTYTITTEMIKAFSLNGRKLNVAKYLISKGLKVREFIFDRNKGE